MSKNSSHFGEGHILSDGLNEAALRYVKINQEIEQLETKKAELKEIILQLMGGETDVETQDAKIKYSPVETEKLAKKELFIKEFTEETLRLKGLISVSYSTRLTVKAKVG